jgi:hypothetical protein
MPQFPSAPRPDHSRPGARQTPPPRIPAQRTPPPPRTSPTSVSPSTTQATVQAQAKGGVDLTLNKVLAGAGAAATSAVLGSFFGAAGTVTGAALGSVASTVAATLYQQSLDRTRDKIAARIRFTRGHGMDAVEERASEITMPMPRISPEAATTHFRVEPRVEPVVEARSPRRRFVLWSAATVLVFLLGLLAVTGVEWAKGSTLTSGQSGTSVGRVIEGDHESRNKEERVDPTTTPEPTSTPTPSADPSTDPSTDPSAGQDSSGATPADDPGSGGSAPSGAPAPGGDSGDLRNDGPGNDGSGDDGSGNGGSGDGGSGDGGSGNDRSGNERSGGDSSGNNGGAVPTPLVLAGQRRSGAEAGRQCGGRRSRVLGLCDRPHHDDPVGAGVQHLVEPGVVDAADGEPRPRRRSARHRSHEVESRRRATRLGRRGPARADAEVVDARLLRGRRGLVRTVRRTPDHHVVAHDLARPCDGKVVLAEVQDIGPGGQRHVGPVVHREQRSVPGTRLGEHLQRRELLTGLQRAVRALVAQLEDVDAAGERRVGEPGEVAGAAPRVGAEVEAGVGQPRAQGVSVESGHGDRPYAAPDAARTVRPR